MAAAGGKPAYSNRLASMGFMKRAAGVGSNANQSAADTSRAQSHAAASTSQPSLRQQHQQQQKRSSDSTPADDQQQQQQHHKKPKHQLSDKLSSMKFMQRAQAHKRGFDEAIGQEDAAKAEAEWKAPAAADSSTGCLIIQERDPLPAGVCGRMSFGKFNPDTELLQATADAVATGKPLPTAAAVDSKKSGDEGAAGVSVTDDDMAAGWGKGRAVLTSLRMQRTHKRQKVH